MNEWHAAAQEMQAEVHDVFGVSATLAGVPLRVRMNYDAEIMMGQIYDHRTTASFLQAELAAAAIEPAKGALLVVGDQSYRLDQRLPTSSPHIAVWMLR